MKKLYYLSTCSTCKRIMNDVGEQLAGFEIQDIKKKAITAAQVDEMKNLSGSYENIFSKRSRSFQSMGLAEKSLSEDDYRSLILEDYTFLKRPVFIVEDETSTPVDDNKVEDVKPSEPPAPLSTIESDAGSKPVIDTLLSKPTMLVPSKLTSKVNTSAAEVAEYAPPSS